MSRDLPCVSIGELSRTTGAVVDEVLRGGRFLVCRHRRPVATLQPLDGVVVQPSGRETDVAGSPLGDAEQELSKLSPAQRALLLDGISLGRFVPGRASARHPFDTGDLSAELPELVVRGLATRMNGRGPVMLSGRGAVLREALLRRAGRADPLFG